MPKSVRLICAMLLAGVLSAALLSPIIRAQEAPPHKRSFIQRHPTMTGIAAGMATHHALKVSARNKKRQGKKLSWADRHPTLSAIGVGAATRHVIKKHTH